MGLVIMRILHVSEPTTAGTAVVVRNLSRRGLDLGWSVIVASPPDGDLRRWVMDDGMVHEPLAISRRPPARTVAGVLRLRRMMRESEVVHLHSTLAGVVGRLAAMSLGRMRPKIVFTPHAWSWYAAGRWRLVFQVLEWFLAHWTDVVVAVSLRELADGEPVVRQRARLVCIPNGVDTDKFFRGEVSPVPGLLVCVGRLSRQKGQDLLLRALAGCPEDMRLLLVGDGNDEGDLRRLVESKHLQKRVTFAGPVSDPREFLQKAELVVLPSRWEGLPIVLLEALASGAAIVATTGASADVLDQDAVHVVSSESHDDDTVQALRQALIQLHANPQQRSEMMSLAREAAVNEFSLSVCLERYVDLWQRLVAEGEQFGR